MSQLEEVNHTLTFLADVVVLGWASDWICQLLQACDQSIHLHGHLPQLDRLQLGKAGDSRHLGKVGDRRQSWRSRVRGVVL